MRVRKLSALIWAAYESEDTGIEKVYEHVCALMGTGVEVQSLYDESLLEEVGWRVERVREARASEAYAMKKMREKSQLEEVKKTIQALQASSIRCNCHDFLHWQHLWGVDSSETRCLRDRASYATVRVGGIRPRCSWSLPSSGRSRVTKAQDSYS